MGGGCACPPLFSHVKDQEADGGGVPRSRGNPNSRVTSCHLAPSQRWRGLSGIICFPTPTRSRENRASHQRRDRTENPVGKVFRTETLVRRFSVCEGV